MDKEAVVKRHIIWLVSLFFLASAGCGFHKKPEEQAQSFFGKGKHQIVKSLEQAEATPAQLDQARAVLERHEKTVVGNIGKLLEQQRLMIIAITSGKNTSALLALDQDLHKAHEQAVKSIGKMHEELEAAVGAKTWGLATARMEEKVARYMKN